MPFRVYRAVKIPPEVVGPLSDLLIDYVDWALKRGYAPISVNAHVSVIARFSEWLGGHGLGIECVDNTIVNLYMRSRKRYHAVWPIEHLAIQHLVEFLRELHLLDRPFMPALVMSPLQAQLAEWNHYMQERRGLSESTIRQYLRTGGDFMRWKFKDAAPDMNTICGADVVKFYQMEAKSSSSSQCKMMTNSLRSFCNYLRATGKTDINFSVSVPVAAHWSQSSLPKALAYDVAEEVINHVDRTTANGKRDFAILLLLWRLGLRAGEVSALELDDIDWHSGSILIRRRKSPSARLPLVADVGEAIADYLVHSRPVTTTRTVFLRIAGPHFGLHGAAAIGDIVRKALTGTRACSAGYGAHQFRHGLAMEMLKRGSSLADIGHILGHQSTGATHIYAKVDFLSLRELAVPWPTEHHVLT
ncbi:tyrosine-type recombinase/integrase [Caballeronia sp. M23-90]